MSRATNSPTVRVGFALKVEFPLTTTISSVMPQRGNDLQPRVAASATLGKESDLVLNRNAVAFAYAK